MHPWYSPNASDVGEMQDLPEVPQQYKGSITCVYSNHGVMQFVLEDAPWTHFEASAWMLEIMAMSEFILFLISLSVSLFSFYKIFLSSPHFW